MIDKALLRKNATQESIKEAIGNNFTITNEKEINEKCMGAENDEIIFTFILPNTYSSFTTAKTIPCIKLLVGASSGQIYAVSGTQAGEVYYPNFRTSEIKKYYKRSNKK